MIRLRADGFLPGVVYGRSQKNYLLTLNTKQFQQLLYKGLSLNDPLTLKVNADKEGFSTTVFIKQLQRDPVNNDLQHVDFYAVEPTQKVSLPVEIVAVGTPLGKEQGGTFQQVASEITAEGLLEDLPRQIEVDVSGLGIGESIVVSQLKVPENIRVLESEDKVLFHVLTAKKVYLE